LPYLIGAMVLVLGLSLALRWVAQPPAGERFAPRVDVSRARAALTASDWTEAIRILSPTGEVPAAVEARRLLADALHARCQAEGGEGFERAARMRELSIADEPRAGSALRARAELESSHGDQLRAVSWWDAALNESRRQGGGGPAHEDLLLDTAVARALAGEFVRAEILLEELLQLRPEHALALLNRGMLHLRAGRWGSAHSDLSRAGALDPSLAGPRAGRLEARRRFSVERESDEAGHGDLENSDSVTGQHALALLALEAGDRGRARERLRTALELAPDEPRLIAEWEALAEARP
jgi:tetratricopeptide (TPR) repeat protein